MSLQSPAQVLNVCISQKKGTQKRSVATIRLLSDHGIEGDAHAGKGHRQVSLLADESAETVRQKGVPIQPGDFGENILTQGIKLDTLTIGDEIVIGEVVLTVTQIGKTCHNRCAIFDAAGICVMPTSGVFCRVKRGGTVRRGDPIEVKGGSG